jgi:hypothetical protein
MTRGRVVLIAWYFLAITGPQLAATRLTYARKSTDQGRRT